MASGGFGRGGRGAALLQALSQPARKPGDNGQESSQQQASGSAPPVAPTGRGALLASVLSAQAQQTTPGTTPGGDAPVVPRPMGRGLASMQALLKASGQSLPQTTARGAAFISQQAETQVAPHLPSPQKTIVPPTQQSPVKPKTPPQTQQQEISTGAPPTRGLASMTLDRKPVIHNSGEVGQPLKLSANYIRIKCKNKGVYQYHVDFRPNIDSKGMRIRLINEHRDVIGFTKAFDGSILYLPIKLEQQETVLHSERPTDQAKITIVIRQTKVLPPESCQQLYNIVFRRIMTILQMVQVGRYYYNPHTPSSVPQHKLEVWPGYITAVAEQEGGLMLLADASHRVLRTETVLDVMTNIVNRNAQGFRDEVIRTLVGTVVLTRYNNKTYKVDDIVWDKTPKQTFSTHAGGEMSFLEYYKKNYNLTIQDHEQPLLLHRPRKKLEPGGQPRKQPEVICLIPELCYMSGLTDALRQDFRVMKDLACHTRVTPEQRRLTMKKFIDSVNNTPEAKAELEKWGLELETNTLQFDGRLLPEEEVIFSTGKVSAGPNADWGQATGRQQVITAVPLRTWVVLYTRRDQSKANDFITWMLKLCPQMGIDCSPPIRFELRDDRVETYIRALREQINPKIQLVVPICPTSRDDRYSAIKKTCCVDHPIPSQVIIGKTIGDQKKIRSVVQKIALQINCKLGGELWGVSIPFKSLMVVGIDIYHDSAGKRQSICGFVASMNRNCTRWFSRCTLQPVSQEIVDGLKICLVSALTKFHEVNHSLPDKILVFRDGVGDGQLNTVADYEVSQLRTCFTSFGEYSPKLSFVVVQKRINTRIFLNKGRQMENPPSGTVADHTITRREWYDFFLVSQHVRQGTVSPTHYIVVSDDSGMKPDHMQRMAYKMTHMYYNWPGTVRVPAPCQYAHKLAQLVGQNIHKEPSQELSDRLFFL